ncbi:hypothetical protein CWO90_18205 [Bradyrhizobium sp. Leo121]|nr:hypothetical protein CWO90_18205 [Bradyrhizobium sp. Leo121]
MALLPGGDGLRQGSGLAREGQYLSSGRLLNLAPLLRGEVGAPAPGEGTRRIHGVRSAWRQPLTPALSPQERGEGD